MVHTAELTFFPSRNLIKDFQQLKDSYFYQQDNVWYNGSLSDQGLIFRLKIIKVEDFTSPRLICRVNFSKLLHPDDKISLITEQDADAVEKRFNALVQCLSPQFPKFESWYVNRIDYCINVHTPYVEEYLNLMKKGDRLFMKDPYDHNGNYGQKQGSLYLISTAKSKKDRSVTINFYNKLDELLKSLLVETGKVLKDEDLEDLPKDILRLEIQCHKRKTEHLKKKYNMPSKTIKYFLKAEIAYDVISTGVIRIAGFGDYHRKSIALDMIDQTKCRTLTKEKMKRLIQDVAKQYSSIEKVRNSYMENNIMKKDEFNNLVRTLQKHNINPVTIGNKKHLDNRTLKEGLESVFSIFENAFNEEMKEK